MPTARGVDNTGSGAGVEEIYQDDVLACVADSSAGDDSTGSDYRGQAAVAEISPAASFIDHEGSAPVCPGLDNERHDLAHDWSE